MERMVDEERTFDNFPYAQYVTDVTFQQANRPSGNAAEGKKYFSGKQKLYEFKVEISVLPNRIAANCTENVPGSVSDMDIIYRNRLSHTTALQKVHEEGAITDVEIFSDQYDRTGSVLGDKGYQGAAEFIRILHLYKKPPRKMLGLEDEGFNREVSAERIIVEIWFGLCVRSWQ